MHQGMCCLLGFKFSFKLSTASFKVFFQTLSYEKTNLQKVQIGTIYSIQHRQEKNRYLHESRRVGYTVQS